VAESGLATYCKVPPYVFAAEPINLQTSLDRMTSLMVEDSTWSFQNRKYSFDRYDYLLWP